MAFRPRLNAIDVYDWEQSKDTSSLAWPDSKRASMGETRELQGARVFFWVGCHVSQ